MPKFYEKYAMSVAGSFHEEDGMMYGTESHKCMTCEDGTMWVSLEFMANVCSTECLELARARVNLVEEKKGKKRK
jgi:hypothetical protein